MKEIFCDGIANLSLTHGLVICDFFHLVPDRDKPSQRESFFRVTVPLQGFVGLVSIGEEVVSRLVKLGVYHARPADSAEAPKSEKKAAKKAAAPAKKSEAAKPAAKAAAPAKKSEAAKPAAKAAPEKKTEAAKPAAKAAPAKKAAPTKAKKPAK